MTTRPDPQHLIDIARRTDAACAAGRYTTAAGAVIDIAPLLAASLDGTQLIFPEAWPAIEQQALAGCPADAPLAPVSVTDESTLAALHRLAVNEGRSDVAALNFASARNPGGGYRNGAMAQEETIARSSGLAPTLERCWTYYERNRAQESLLYTDHAIWSPMVPIVAHDDGTLLAAPYQAGIITMPAPNTGAMRTEADLRAVLPTFGRRIRYVLALAVARGVRHLVLGAWGCGAFGNDPGLVARLFRQALAEQEPWRRGLQSVTFAIIDTSRRRASFAAFSQALSDLTH